MIDRNHGIGAHCVEYWDNSSAPKLIQNKHHNDLETDNGIFIHSDDLNESQEQTPSFFQHKASHHQKVLRVVDS